MALNGEAVHTEHLSKVYKDFWGRDKVRALDDLNLTIHRGEVFGLLGPNGSGKSTTIKLLLGLIFPSMGTASVLGEPAGSTAINERIGFLPEESYLYRFLNGEETLYFYGRLFKIPRKELRKRVPALLDTVGLDEKARKRKLREYSKGMARRIGLAQALVHDPRLLILDEPTAGVDPVGSAAITELIRALKAQGKTVLITSHLLGQIEEVCDRVAILDRGRLVVEGAVADLVGRADRQALVVEKLGAADLAEFRAWLAARGKTLESVETPRTRLDRVFLAHVRRGQAEDGAGREETGA